VVPFPKQSDRLADLRDILLGVIAGIDGDIGSLAVQDAALRA
jgi:hypothetical protein